MSTFTIAPNKAYMIRNGKPAEPVRISVVTGSVMHLHEIDGLTKDVKVCSLSTGGCGKMEQWPAVAFADLYPSGSGTFRFSKGGKDHGKELYQTVLRDLNVTSGEIDSIRKKSITKSGCRVYDGSYLGVSGVLGEPTPEAWTQAEANLSRRIPCPWGPETGKRRTCRRGTAMDAGRFLQLAEELLKTLRQDFPQFIFSNKINFTEDEVRLQNDGAFPYAWQGAAVFR